MILDSISVRNFMGYRQRVEVDLQGKHTVGIAGSNESGKSSLLQAVSYAGWGKTRADRDVKLINDDADGPMVVGVGFRLPGDELLEVERGRQKNGDPILKATGFRGKVSECAEYIASKLSLPYDDFVSLSYFVQGDIHGFMSGNKRDYFQRWTSGLEYWSKLESYANAWLEGIKRAIDSTMDEVQEAGDLIGGAEDVKRALRGARQSLQEAEKEGEEAQERIDRIRDALADLRASQEDKGALSDVQGQIQQSQRAYDRLGRSKHRLERELEQISKGMCPVLDDVHCKKLEAHSAGQRRGINERLSELADESKEVLLALDALNKKRKQLEKASEPVDTSELDEAHAEARRDLHAAHRKRDKANRELGAAKAAGEKIQAAMAKLPRLRKSLADEEVRARRVQFLRYMCGKTGVPLQIIEAELGLVEEKCNWVFDRLGYPKRIRFAAFRELAEFEKLCPVCGGDKWRNKVCRECHAPRPHRRRDEPTVTILDGTSERVFELESGGAQVLESFAVRLACGLFRSNMTTVPMTLVLLDEVFAMLDASNRQKLMTLVIEKLSTEFGLKQQLVVSHHEDVIHAVDDLLIVSKEKGASVARWA